MGTNMKAKKFAEEYAKVLARVAKGAKWLNKHEPGWFKKVNIDVFDIKNEYYCIIGCVLGEYDQIWDGKYEKSEKWAYNHGFDAIDTYGVSIEDNNLYYSMLQEAWVDYLRMVK